LILAIDEVATATRFAMPAAAAHISKELKQHHPIAAGQNQSKAK
jgi:hypothetical protein